MRILDRYTGKFVSYNTLPQKIDLGRYSMQKGDGMVDLTNSNSELSVDQFINQDLLAEDNLSVQKLFQKMRDKERIDWQSVSPILQKSEINLTRFEKMLYDYLFHLEEIARQPHYLLDRTIEKVPTSRAKRIPSKSYQYLASHTEDWNARSIVQFKPSKVLNEELEVNYNVYENQLFVAFIQRTLVYISSRIKETTDLQDFLKNYELLLSNRSSENVWWKKVERNLSLIGSEYEDEYTQKAKADILSTTAETLRQMRTRLCTLQLTELYQSVDLRATNSVQLRNTNVLIGHKHYRYLRDLWRELNVVRVEQTEEEKIIYEQETLEGLRSYARSALIYACKQLDYSISGEQYHWMGKHEKYPMVTFSEKDGIINLMVGNRSFRFVVIANAPYVSEKELQDCDVYLLSYNATILSKHVIPISPLDADTIERIGSFVKTNVITQMIEIIHHQYPYPSKLTNFLRLMNADYIKINSSNRSYSYVKYPEQEVTIEKIKHCLACDAEYKAKSHPERQAIEKDYEQFLSVFKNTTTKIKENLYCPNCFAAYQTFMIEDLSYLQCPDCGCILDSSQSERAELINKEEKYKNISLEDWGMDYISIDIM